MSHKILFYLFLIIFPVIVSCKKEGHAPVKNLRLDPLYDASFGQLIQLDGNSVFYGAIWGRHSNELVLSSEKGVFLMNLQNNSAEQLLTADNKAYVTQLTGDKQSAIFFGTANSTEGYFSINLSSKQITTLLEVSNTEAASLNYGFNDMFYSKGGLVTVGRPCESWDDIFCGTRQGVVNSKFRHVNKITGKTQTLPSTLSFVTYSADGLKALLVSGNNPLVYYLFDVATQKLGDSVTASNESNYRTFSWNTDCRYVYRHFPEVDIIIKELFSGNELKRFQSNLNLIQSDFFNWSGNGNKLYYSGPCTNGTCTYAINMFDVNTSTEKELVKTNSPDLQSSPFIVSPSPDDSKLLFNDGYNFYLKQID